MIEEKIYIRYIGDKFHIKTIQIHVTDIEYVEQLIDRALEDIGIGPVYGSLFGLKLTNSLVWLRPNVPIKTILASIYDKRSNFEDAKLELRMQFRPFDFTRLAVQDKIAFDIVFAQIRTDFMKTRFNNEKRDFVLLNNAVISLIVLDLIRHAIENSINIEEVLEKVNPRDFIPKRSARWQRPLLFHLTGKTNLEKALLTGYEQCDGDVNKIKQKYMELFLLQVAKDYGADEYTVRRAVPTQTDTQGWLTGSDRQLVRVHYSCSKLVSSCTIESKFIDKSAAATAEVSSATSLENSTQSEKTHSKTTQSTDSTESWKVLIDLETINHLTISGRVVQLAGRNIPPIRFQFEKHLYAESFVSTIDGYYRLLKKWQVNICSEIKSPSLVYLKELGSHGPIGYESTRNKLSKSGYDRPGYFLVRKCMEIRNRFLIDTTLQNRVRLSIDIDWIADSQLFRQVGHSVNRTNFELEIKTVHQDYRQLKHLINDIEIHYQLANETKITHQLKYWIRPDDDDDYPGLLLSISQAKLKELENSLNLDDTESIEQLPQVIPVQFVQLTGTAFKGCNNGHMVDLAVFNERNVIVKKSTHKPNQDNDVTSDNMENVSFHFCPNGHDDLRLVTHQDWVFIKVHLIAETVGYMLSGALVQEYFPHGRLELLEWTLANRCAMESIEKKTLISLSITTTGFEFIDVNRPV